MSGQEQIYSGVSEYHTGAEPVNAVVSGQRADGTNRARRGLKWAAFWDPKTRKCPHGSLLGSYHTASIL